MTYMVQQLKQMATLQLIVVALPPAGLALRALGLLRLAGALVVAVDLLAKAAALEVEDGLPDLLLRVHDERAVTRHLQTTIPTLGIAQQARSASLPR